MAALVVLGACTRGGPPAQVVDHGRPLMSQTVNADARTLTVDPPPAAAPVPNVAVQTLPGMDIEVAVARPPAPTNLDDLPPPIRSRGAARFIVREKPDRPVRPGAARTRPSAAPQRLAALPEPPARGASGFLMPVAGRVLSGYGAQRNGLVNDGINIAAPKGSPVRAAEAGVVAYAGDELRGFGRLLLIQHADGYVTAYAHNDRLLVVRGDVVTRGQVIATVGSSGGVSAPQLHFEIRQGTRAVDPTRLLAQGQEPTARAAAPAGPPNPE